MSHLNRRGFLASGVALSASLVFPAVGFAQTPPAPPPSGPFKLDPLAYAFNALEPHIDAKTMELHHDRHHAAAVNGLNAALKDHGQVASMRLETILVRLPDLPEEIRTAVRNNAGSHANHSMFWQVMGPNGGAPSAELTAAIDRDFGGMDKFKDQFNAAGGRLFGSGWVFVTVDSDGKLALVSRPNQDTPLMDGRRVLMGNDVWEHAYYLNYQNRRPDYLKAWWNTINWAKVSERYTAGSNGTLGI
ncbi:MAG: Manganese/iron superoxide dismutase-like protein [Xanthobacteraceae bacterium]|jgi:Fe-Mn family superoxide dismutase|nr:Manganese/iron superoxide dismutase-like protein [Xanthobacteraceae bacterium]